MRFFTPIFLCGWLVIFMNTGRAAEVQITVQADHVTHTNTPYLTGACLEDVNHEVYGGIDSQMIYGESFAEPAPARPLKGFKTFGGHWTRETNAVAVDADNGAKIVAEVPAFSAGEASVEVRFADAGNGNAGLIVKVAEPSDGADTFDGYEISLEPAGHLVLGRHRQNWEPIRNIPCPVPLNEWVTLKVRMTGKSLEVFVNGQSLLQYEDTEHPLESGMVGLRTWQKNAEFRNLTVATAGETRQLAFETEEDSDTGSVSGAWQPVNEGSGDGEFSLDLSKPFIGHQSQCISYARDILSIAGPGAVGIKNEGLNQQGMNFVKGKLYEGYVYARAKQPTELYVALESRDGTKTYAEKRLKVSGDQWQRLDFQLKPKDADSAGRFAIKLKQHGSVTLGYAFLQPGKWGRFAGLPVRRDVGDGLVNQGVTVMRLGGCLANAPEYRWKQMIGPRAQRPPYKGYWHPYSSNGWGIFDFLNYCEAAGMLGIPDVNINETPQDMADFIEYANGSADSDWGKRRVADGHPTPYHLKYLELGNEERVDENYWQKFEPMAKAIWARDPEIILVVGDFAYDETFTDPFHFTGNPDHLTTLAAQQKILQLAKANNREVWFDVHVNTEGPRPKFNGTFSYIDALDRLAEGAKHHVVVFELNAGNHSQRRALANAAAIDQIERDGRLPICTSANCLQPDGQNDNDWNQGLLFLNPSQVWLQPPGYVTRMIARAFQPLQLATELLDPDNQLDVSAQRSGDGKTLVVHVVNFADHAVSTDLNIEGFVPANASARVEQLGAPLDANNTAAAREQVKPTMTDWPHGFSAGKVAYSFPAYSFTVIQFK